MIKKKLIKYIIIYFTPLFTFAQNIDTQKLDKYFDALEQNNKFMGSVAVSQNGKILYKRTIGFLDVSNNSKADSQTKYRIGSVSKTFTSVLILKAFEDKKLDIDQAINAYFPLLKNAGKITIRQLLMHRSGIHNFTDNEDYESWMTEYKSKSEMISLIVKSGSDFEPDAKSQYSNSNYVLLTYILEEVYKKPYSQLLSAIIAKPAGLSNTYLGGKIHTQNNEAKSYEYINGWKQEPETDISIPLGAGGIVSTPSDIVKFSDALFTGKLIKKETLEIMKTIRDSYGMGLMQFPFYEHTGFGHSGSIDGFTSVFSYFPDNNISFALISNGLNHNGNQVPLTVLGAVYGKSFDIPDFKMYKYSNEELLKYTGKYVSGQIPIAIVITASGNTLVAQATGQQPIALDSKEKDKFIFEQGGIVLEFDTKNKTMLLKQAGQEFTFTKE